MRGALLLIAAAVVLGGALLSPARAQSDWRVTVIAMGQGRVADVFRAGVGGRDTLILETKRGAFLGLSLRIGEAMFFRIDAFVRPAPPRRADMLPDGVLSTGSRGIAEAWLIGPTQRYRHGIMGDAIEASGLRVVTAEGRTLEARLGPASVFEDRLARLADVDGDGRDEVLVVRSYLDAGAALAVYEVRDGAMRRKAEAAPIGRHSRWLTPVGDPDFDGDGAPEAAAIITPHIGGILKIYSAAGERLVEEGATPPGFSNHAIGSRTLGLSAIADANGDGVPDIFAPSADRRAMRIVTFAGGRFVDLARVPLPASVATALVRVPGTEHPTFAFGLSDGSLAILRSD